MSNDNWQHRGTQMKCNSCMWYSYKLGNIGRCRRHAPTISGYPVVYASDWCGDHKIDETKLSANIEKTEANAQCAGGITV